MNEYIAIDVSYLRPSRTIETILLKKDNEKRIVYVYNYEGVHFRVFNSVIDIIRFFDEDIDTKIIFETEKDEKLDNYLANLDLKSIDYATDILR